MTEQVWSCIEWIWNRPITYELKINEIAMTKKERINVRDWEFLIVKDGGCIYRVRHRISGETHVIHVTPSAKYSFIVYHNPYPEGWKCTTCHYSWSVKSAVENLRDYGLVLDMEAAREEDKLTTVFPISEEYVIKRFIDDQHGPAKEEWFLVHRDRDYTEEQNGICY